MKTKLFKRLGATVLALGMALSVMAIPTSAAVNNDSTGNITVNNVDSGATVTAYKVIDVNTDGTQPQEPVYQWNDAVVSWVEDNYPAYIDIDKDNAVTETFQDLESDDVAEPGALAAFYDALAAAIKSNDDSIGSMVPFTATVPADATSVTIENATIGNYLILVTNGTRLYSPASATVGVTFNAGTGWTVTNGTADVAVNVKSTAPGTEKEVDTSAGSSIGNTLSFTITADVPQYPINALYTTFNILDTMSAGLTFNNDIQVYHTSDDEANLLTPGTHYTLAADPGEATFVVEMNYEDVKAYDTIIVTYTATINDAALVTDKVNNKSEIQYDRDPYTESDYIPGSDEVDVYNYEIDVTKVDKNHATTVLPGAEFTLSVKDGDAIYFVLNEETGVYEVAESSDVDGATTTLVTDENGLLKLDGLGTGTYTLTETKAPDNYVLPEEPSRDITISDEDNDGLIGTGDDDTSRIVAVTVENTSSSNAAPSLPTTGGMGTILFTTVGLVLVGGAAILLVVMYKRKKEN